MQGRKPYFSQKKKLYIYLKVKIEQTESILNKSLKESGTEMHLNAEDPSTQSVEDFCCQLSKHTIKHHNEMNQLFQLNFQSFLTLHLKIKQIECLLKINYIATLSNLLFNRTQTRKCPIL